MNAVGLSGSPAGKNSRSRALLERLLERLDESAAEALALAGTVAAL